MVRAVECELSVAPLYDGQPLISDVLAYFCDIGFHLVALEPGFRHPRTGQFLQFNGLFLA